MSLPPTVVVAAFCLGAAVLALALRRAWARRQRVRRATAASAAERRAEGLLRRHGYRVVGRQVRRRWPVRVGGHAGHVDLRVDLVVRRAGRRFAAEVKHGDLVASASHGPTRRQLLEYLLAFRTDGVLLVDVRAGTVDEVRFPALAPAPLRDRAGALRLAAVTVALLVGAAAVAARDDVRRVGGDALGRLSERRASGGCGGASGPRSDP